MESSGAPQLDILESNNMKIYGKYIFCLALQK